MRPVVDMTAVETLGGSPAVRSGRPPVDRVTVFATLQCWDTPVVVRFANPVPADLVPVDAERSPLRERVAAENWDRPAAGPALVVPAKARVLREGRDDVA